LAKELEDLGNANPISIKIALKSLNFFYTLFMAYVFEQWSEVDFK
jgi:hypothetical protein